MMITYTHVEIASPGHLRNGRRFFTVDVVESDSGRCGMWSGTDYGEAILAAGDCEEDGVPVIDRVVEGIPDAR